MSERTDLTRWNRAGRTRFEYVDGNAVEHMETLRQQLVKKFEDRQSGWFTPTEIIPADEAELENETLIQRQQRLSLRQKRILETYYQDRRDWVWEITRSFARCCHILTGYVDAYANEGFLGTATQWDHVRRLVEMLDYHPAPPASAATWLAFIAKDGMSGTVASGFQVKNSPPTGGEKVIFETLEDLFVDPALNKLRPKGWNQLRVPDDNGNTQPPVQERQFSSIANGPVFNLQGIGITWAGQLNTVPGYSESNFFRIRNFLDLDPETPGIILPVGTEEHIVGENWLREFKAKATVISDFELEPEWSSLIGRLLPEIASENPDLLTETTGNSLDEVKALQLRIELIGAYLDQQVYENARLIDLLMPADSIEGSYDPSSVPTFWRAKQKPRIVPGQVAMIHSQFRDESDDIYVDEAAAAAIASIAKQTDFISLLPGPGQNIWSNWNRSETQLKVSPRWKRECWLNNESIDVVRTEKAHGLSADTYICWKNIDEEWEYANVIEADKRDLRLKLTGALPQIGAEIVIASPFEGDKMAAEYEAIVLLNEVEDITDTESIVTSVTPELVEPDHLQDPLFKPVKIFPIDVTSSSSGGGGLLPPASLPKIGTFLFPSPMLPMDLVKAAVEMMLSLGVMQIPSTEEFVLKGLPPGGLLEGAENLADAAASLFKLLDDLEIPAKWESGFLVDLEDNPIYLELTCEDGELPVKCVGGVLVDLQNNLVNVVNSAEGDLACTSSNVLPVKCLGEKVVDISTDEPVGYQPHYTDLGFTANPGDGTLVHLKMIEWGEDQNGDPIVTDDDKTRALTSLINRPESDETTLFKTIEKRIEVTTSDGSKVMVDAIGPLLAVLEDNPPVQAIVQASDPLYMFNGSSKIEAGDWVVGRFTDGLRALKVSAINVDIDSDQFSISFKNLIGNEAELKKIYADFRGELSTEEFPVNTTLVNPGEIELEDNLPDTLKIGREILLIGCNEPVVSKITEISSNTIKIDPPVSGCTLGKLIIYGNVVAAGHGISKPAKILGSGDATKSNQEFTLEVGEVSFTPDTTKNVGVAAAIDFIVDGRVWEQVSTLKDSAPDDHHFVVRMTEEAHVKIICGDGQYGRRLPSGKNNLLVRYRVGSGIVGNIPAHSLKKPVNPHPLVDSVNQWLPATGGGDMEDKASLKQNAPSTTLALERAVSLTDYSHLAAAQSSIWQATAYSVILHGGRMESVKVIIVPAGGVSSIEINKDLRSFLQQHALPGVQVSVGDFNSRLFDLTVAIRVDFSAFNSNKIQTAVETALTDHFSLRYRGLGEHLYLSEVYKTVEGVEGVENSICVLNDDKNLRVIRADEQGMVIHLDTIAGSTLTVTTEEYLP